MATVLDIKTAVDKLKADHAAKVVALESQVADLTAQLAAAATPAQLDEVITEINAGAGDPPPPPGG